MRDTSFTMSNLERVAPARPFTMADLEQAERELRPRREAMDRTSREIYLAVAARAASLSCSWDQAVDRILAVTPVSAASDMRSAIAAARRWAVDQLGGVAPR